ncbi:MAG: DHH family phosphoesterase [Lachnospiraceae bacterium]|nr:DHH family phosphoesterase [Lachnospiraceae bacterium]
MRLSELEKYNPITIQCHDNPDADAIASGFGLYTYFKSKGKDVRLIYSGRNRIHKANLKLMVEKLEIPVVYMEEVNQHIEGLLITVDCQYGAGNVTRLDADRVAVIDHHQVEIGNIELQEIRSNLGSCSTLVWRMMLEEGYPVEKDSILGTALYYGLYSDTNQFAEISNPLDMDLRDSIECDMSLIRLFRNSNLTLKELELAGIALIRYIYNDDHRYAIIKAQPCDPNILGIISDFLIQVDEVWTCIVYNEINDGYKLSVRSCIKEVDASELAAFVSEKIGSGGGHIEKAGGFISKKLYEEYYPTLHSEAYFSEKVNEYFDNTQIIYADEYEIDISDMKKYIKKKIPVGYVKAAEILPVGTPITIRTLEGDVDMTVEPDLYIMIGIKGEVYPTRKSKFEKSYQILDEPYDMHSCAAKTDYVPTIKNRMDGSTQFLTNHASACIPTGKTSIYAKPMEHMVKVFTAWDKEKYMVGKTGDYLAVRCDDLHDIYVVEEDIFEKTYEQCGE